MRCRGFGTVVLVIASVMATGVFAPALNAADNRGYVFDNGNPYPSLNYTLHNGTLPNASFQRESETAPAPVTIYNFELGQTSLPGPRYMAYGPSTIALAIDLRIIAVLIAIGAIIIGVWYLYPRNGKDDKEE